MPPGYATAGASGQDIPEGCLTAAARRELLHFRERVLERRWRAALVPLALS